MRISHRHKFIFLAMPRTGSTSVRALLDAYSDIKSVHKRETTEDFPFYHHISAAEVKAIFDARGWDYDAYTTFCVVRNPYDRAVSLYHHHLRMRRTEAGLSRLLARVRPTPRFRDYVMRMDPARRLPVNIANFTCDANGTSLVDRILRFEALREELPGFLRELGIQVEAEDIPHLNLSESRRSYADYFDAELKHRVHELYSDDIRRFGYAY